MQERLPSYAKDSMILNDLKSEDIISLDSYEEENDEVEIEDK